MACFNDFYYVFYSAVKKKLLILGIGIIFEFGSFDFAIKESHSQNELNLIIFWGSKDGPKNLPNSKIFELGSFEFDSFGLGQGPY